MKKCLLFLILTTVLFSCKKDNSSENSEGNHSEDGGNESVQITDISFPDSPEFLISELDTDGKVMAVSLKPANAPTSLLEVSVEDEAVITAEVVPEGILVKPHQVGTSELYVSTTFGPATEKSILVNVKKSDEYSDYTINSITAQENTVELDDDQGRTRDLEITLDVDGATLKDVHISSGNEQIVKVEKLSDGKTIRFTSVKAGEATVTVTALRGSGKLSIPVTVYGHITSMSISVPGSFSDTGGCRGILIDSDPTLTAVFEKTGNLRYTNVEWSSSGAYFTINNSTGKLRVYSASGSGYKQTVTATSGSFSATIDIRVYENPTKISLKNADGSGSELTFTVLTLKQNTGVNYKVVVSPERAHQDYEVSSSNNSSVFPSKYNNNILGLQGSSAAYNNVTVTLTPAHAPQGSSVKKTFEVTVNQYEASDLKYGDYIYYKSSDKKFYHSDGGLRYLNSDKQYRKESVGQVSSKGTFIGYAFGFDLHTDTDTDLATIKNKLPGLADASGKHVYVVADGTGDMGGWSSTSFNYFQTSGDSYKDYTYKLLLDSWNASNPSQLVTAHKRAVAYNTTLPVLTATSSSSGSTGWMLPSRASAQAICNNLPFIRLGGWTACSGSTYKAYYFNTMVNNSYVGVYEYDKAGDAWHQGTTSILIF